MNKIIVEDIDKPLNLKLDPFAVSKNKSGKTVHIFYIAKQNDRIPRGANVVEGEIRLKDGLVLQPIPQMKTRDTIYVAGPSGSGKSTYVSKYTEMYEKMFPGNPIYLLSRVDDDDSLDKLNITRIKINEELVTNPLVPEDVENSLVIFDDTDTIQDKNIRDSLTHFKNDLLETGRHNNITVAITSHLINKSHETRTVINESQNYTFFPYSGSTKAIKYLLSEYIGVEKSMIVRILNLDTRWVTIKKTYPMVVMYEKGFFFLHSKNDNQ